jgi:predicted O-methyltransferase YrrM
MVQTTEAQKHGQLAGRGAVCKFCGLQTVSDWQLTSFEYCSGRQNDFFDCGCGDERGRARPYSELRSAGTAAEPVKSSFRLVFRRMAHFATQSVLALHHNLPPRQRIAWLNPLYRLLSPLPPGRIRQSAMEYVAAEGRSAPTIADAPDRIAETVRTAAEVIYGDRWNSFSDALRPEVVLCFKESIKYLSYRFAAIDYLEIGSAQGLSMAFIGTSLALAQRLGTLVSLDPYFERGYADSGYHVAISKNTRERAVQLYASLRLQVSMLEKPSSEGLIELLKAGRKFHLIYIDGCHSGLMPTLDFGVSYHLLHDGGVVMIDDHLAPDIVALKALCDRYCQRICECWKVAGYTPRP